MTGRALVVQGDALRLPLPDESVDLIVTSPPFYQLRRYDTSCRICEDVIASGGDPRTAFDPGWDDHVARFHHGVGLEATPQDYLDALLAATREMVRVLKPTGSLFVELGDKYNTHAQGNAPDDLTLHDGQQGARQVRYRLGDGRGPRPGFPPPKSLMGLPWRYALRCVDDLGLILRAEIIWSRVNGLPESVTDRVRAAHSRIFHLTKSPRYYSALDTLREPHSGGAHPSGNGASRQWVRSGATHRALDTDPAEYNPLGKLPGSVWAIPSDPLRLPPWLGVNHYAAFPPELPRRLILGWSPPGVCVECGEGRRPVVKHGPYRASEPGGGPRHVRPDRPEPAKAEYRRDYRESTTLGYVRDATILGWACSCTPFTDHPGTGEPSGPRYGNLVGRGLPMPSYNAGSGNNDNLGNRPKVGPWREYHLDGWQAPPTRPAVILDPFGGVGTTCLTARALGRIGISVDLSHAYSRAARWRVYHSGEWQQIIERTTGRRAKPLPKHDPHQGVLL